MSDTPERANIGSNEYIGVLGTRARNTRIISVDPVEGTAAAMAADAAAIILAGAETANQGKRWENTTDGLVYDFRPVGGTWGYYLEPNADASGNIPTTLKDAIAGETNPSSETNSYIITREANHHVFPTGAVPFATAAANDAYLVEIQIHTTLIGAVRIDGFFDTSGVSRQIIIPIGTTPQRFKYANWINAAGALTVSLDSGGDSGDVSVAYGII